MQRGDAPDDRQAQAAARRLLPRRTIKTLANARERLRANAWAVIAHPELAGVERDIDLAAARAIAYGVIQQIAHQQTEQQRLAGADDMAGIKMQAQLNPGLLRRVIHLHHCRLQQIGDSDLLHIIQLGERVQPRQRQQLIHQSGGAIDPLVELIQRFLTPFGIVQGELGDFGLHLQRRQRAA